MKAILIFGICAVVCIGVNAQSQGPLFGSDFTTIPISGSSATWNNTSSATPSDDMYSDFGDIPDGPGAYTDYLVVSNFNFNLPTGVTITGILVEVEMSDPNGYTAESSVRIINLGAMSPADKSNGASYPGTDTYVAYGGSTDLWGDSWTEKAINDPTFGVAISAQRKGTGGATLGQIDDIRITVYYSFIILPVNLVSFSAVKGNNVVHLNWTTTAESGMDQYIVERSANGRDFSSIGTVASKNLSSTTNYQVNDYGPVQGTSYYRLKMISNTGTTKYSEIISVHYYGTNDIQLYPNPLVKGQLLYVSNPDREELNVQFFSLGGKLVSSVTTMTATVPLNFTGNDPGTLFYRINNKNGETIAKGKLVLE